MDSFLKNDPHSDERTALLKYYNSQCTTHAGYFVSVFIGLVVALSTSLSEWEKIAKVPITFTVSESIMIPVVSIIFTIIIVILLFGCVYTLNGVLYWGYLASEVIDVDVTQLSEKEKKLLQKGNKKLFSISALHNVTYLEVCKKHPNVVYFKRSYSHLLNFFNNKK